MTIEEVMNKLRKYSSSEVFNAREAGKREAYEHALFLLEAIQPKIRIKSVDDIMVEVKDEN